MNELDNQYMVDMHNEQDKTWFKVDDDSKADWCLRKIKSARDENERMASLLQAQIKYLQDKVKTENRRLEQTASFFHGKLREYWENGVQGALSHTKTQSKYKLASGSLVFKHDKQGMAVDDGALLHYLNQAGLTDFVTTVHGIKWGEYKKQLKIVGDRAVDLVTGEIVEGVSIKTKAGKFEVKL